MTRWYLFADESGNFDFTRKQGATSYFAVGSILIEGDERRNSIRSALDRLSDELLISGQASPGAFHATEDRQVIRNQVYEVLLQEDFSADVTVLEKRKATPSIRTDEQLFYRYAWYYHFKRINWGLVPGDELIVIAATLATKRSRGKFLEALREVIDQQLDRRVKRRVEFWKDDADRCLQAADYALWAVMRDLEQGDDRARKQIEPKLRSVYKPFDNGEEYYY